MEEQGIFHCSLFFQFLEMLFFSSRIHLSIIPASPDILLQFGLFWLLNSSPKETPEIMRICCVFLLAPQSWVRVGPQRDRRGQGEHIVLPGSTSDPGNLRMKSPPYKGVREEASTAWLRCYKHPPTMLVRVRISVALQEGSLALDQSMNCPHPGPPVLLLEIQKIYYRFPYVFKVAYAMIVTAALHL